MRAPPLPPSRRRELVKVRDGALVGAELLNRLDSRGENFRGAVSFYARQARAAAKRRAVREIAASLDMEAE